jgi:hypothetical protein
MRHLRYALLAFLAAPAAPAAAQVPGCTPGAQCVLLQTFIPQGIPAALAASAVSSTVALPAVGPTLGALVVNAGPAAAYVLLGPVGQVVTQYTGTYVAPGSPVWLPIGTNVVLAAVTVAGTANLGITTGTGAPLLIGAPLQIAPAPPLAYVAPDTATVGVASGLLAAAGAYGTALRVCTLPGSSTNVWLNVHGAAAVVGAGIEVPDAGGCATFGHGALPLPAASINAITDAGSPQTVTLAGG